MLNIREWEGLGGNLVTDFSFALSARLAAVEILPKEGLAPIPAPFGLISQED